MKPISVDDVRNDLFWTHPDGGVWRIALYCEHPTVTFERVDVPCENIRAESRGGAVGSPIVSGFRRLVPEQA